jgi:RsiW-degrading membrane proteinase PrsW (M82 family)
MGFFLDFDWAKGKQVVVFYFLSLFPSFIYNCSFKLSLESSVKRIILVNLNLLILFLKD